MPDEIKTIADTIIWIGEERDKTKKYQNLNSAIYSVVMEVNIMISETMARNKAAEEKEKQNGN